MSGVSGGEKNSGRKSATGKKPRGGEMGPGKIAENMSAEDLDALLVGHCRHAATEIPPGKPGARWAGVLLAALPEACRRRLPDVVTTGPRLFAFLVEQGLLAAVPSPRLIPAALGLVAEVSPLLQARGSRQWTLGLARVRDAGSPIAAEIRERTPPSQLDVAVQPPAAHPLRVTVLRAEQEKLAAELAAEKSEAERLRADNSALREQHVKLAGQVAAYERQGADITRLEEKVAALKRDVDGLVSDNEELRAERDRGLQERAEIRRHLGVPGDDARGLVELVAAEVAARRKILAENVALRTEQDRLRAEAEALRQRSAAREAAPADALTLAALNLATQRADKAERALKDMRDELAAAKKSLGELHERLVARKIRLHSAQEQLEAQEIELAEARAELEFRRAWSFLAPVDELQKVRRAAADKARELQRTRRPLAEDGE